MPPADDGAEMRVCINGWDGVGGMPPSGLTVAVRVARRGGDGQPQLSGTTSAAASDTFVAIYAHQPPAQYLSPSRRWSPCADIAGLLPRHGEEYDVQLTAVSGADLVSEPFSTTIAIDGSEPVRGGALVVHTGGPTPTHQVSDCCIRVGWPAWAEPESGIDDQRVCLGAPGLNSSAVADAQAAEGDADCLFVGPHTTAVLLAAGAACACAAPSAAESGVAADAWTAFEWRAVAERLSARALSVWVSASNVLGATVSTQPRALAYQPAAPAPSLVLEPAERLAGLIDDMPAAPAVQISAGGVYEGGALVHAQAAPLRLSWERADAVLERTLCVGAAPSTTVPAPSQHCTMLPADALGTELGGMEAGAHVLRMSLTARSGATSEGIWPLTLAAPPPAVENVRVGFGAPAGVADARFWADAAAVVCSWAFDPGAVGGDDAVFAFEVRVVGADGATGVCVEDSAGGRLGGATLGAVDVPATARSARVPFALDHGAAFRCAVRAAVCSFGFGVLS